MHVECGTREHLTRGSVLPLSVPWAHRGTLEREQAPALHMFYTSRPHCQNAKIIPIASSDAKWKPALMRNHFHERFSQATPPSNIGT